MSADLNQPPAPVGIGEAFRYWLKLGFISFGGPTGQIAIMHQDLVERRRWISERRFLHALNYCMVLPGPEATQLATYIGWMMHRTWGGIVAGGHICRCPLWKHDNPLGTTYSFVDHIFEHRVAFRRRPLFH